MMATASTTGRLRSIVFSTRSSVSDFQRVAYLSSLFLQGTSFKGLLYGGRKKLGSHRSAVMIYAPGLLHIGEAAYFVWA
jgi:hypothetical protein